MIENMNFFELNEVMNEISRSIKKGIPSKISIADAYLATINLVSQTEDYEKIERATSYYPGAKEIILPGKFDNEEKYYNIGNLENCKGYLENLRENKFERKIK